jgi:hypothetical protein
VLFDLGDFHDGNDAKKAFVGSPRPPHGHEDDKTKEKTKNNTFLGGTHCDHINAFPFATINNCGINNFLGFII